MYYQFSSSFYIQSLPGLFAILLILVLWKRRHVGGVLYLILFECSNVIWSLADGLEHASLALDLKIFWSQFAIFGASTIPPLFLLFTLAYFRNEKFPSGKIIALLFLVPAITLGLSTTNQYHHLVWEKVELTSPNSSIYHYGGWFWFYVFYEFALSLFAILILLTDTIKFYRIYKRQIVNLILASILPFIACILYIFKLTPLNTDLTPVSLTLVGIFIAISIFRQGMLDILPIARKQIIKNLSDGIIVIDMANRIVDANPSISAICGINHQKLIGKPFDLISKIIPPDFNHFKEKSSTETAIQVNNETRYFEITFSPVNIQDRRLIGKIFIFNDITRRKTALDSAVTSNNLLRNEIQEKEKLILDLDAYARSVAHDLKNPISGILGLRDLLLDDVMNNKTAEVLELIDIVHEQGLKMYKIVDELLLLSRIRKEDVKPVPIEMPVIIKEALKRLKCNNSSNHFSIDTPDSWPSVLGHPQWIEEVWFNLISNAIKYGGNPPAIKIGYNKLNGSSYQFWIQDNGDGLPPESLSKLFFDFERLGNNHIEGHGLGLSIIRRIVEKLGGEVLVTSENLPGRGCIFSFTLKTNQQLN
jgi:PAS domain S-box-containing protein